MVKSKVKIRQKKIEPTLKTPISIKNSEARNKVVNKLHSQNAKVDGVNTSFNVNNFIADKYAVDNNFFKKWLMSAAIDVVFVLFLLLGLWLINLAVGSLPLTKFIMAHPSSDLLNDPNLLPSKAVLYSGLAVVLGLPILFVISAFFVFVLTRQLFYTSSAKGFWKSSWAMIAGFFMIVVPVLIGIVLIAALIMLLTSYFSGDFIDNLRQIISVFMISILLQVCAIYFVKQQKNKIIEATGIAYKSMISLIKPMLFGGLIVAAISAIFLVFGLFILAKTVAVPTFANVWYVVTSIIIISWLRVYSVSIAEKI